jgi:hypothetical protein
MGHQLTVTYLRAIPDKANLLKSPGGRILLSDNLLDLDPLFLRFAFEPPLSESGLVISLKKLT